MSLFITFEGGEGSGKSLQTRALYRRLNRLSIPAILTHEPGGTTLGKSISRWLKWGKASISPLAELLLFNASRAQLVAEVIQPGLQQGKVVICDRFTDSTTAYQGYGRGLDLDLVKTINNTATKGLKPDLVVLLDILVEEGLARKSASKHDRFEQELIAFHRRVRAGYLKLSADEPERWLVINSTRPKEEVAGIIWQRVTQLIRQKDMT